MTGCAQLGWNHERVQQRMTFTIREDATEEEVASACRAALAVLWEDLAWLDVDLAGLDHDADCAEAVVALQPLRKRRWLSKTLDSVAHLVPGRDDDKLPAVLRLLSRTIGSTGLSRQDARMVFNADDCGRSCVFELTSEQLETLQRRLLADGARVEVLVLWHTHCHCGQPISGSSGWPQRGLPAARPGISRLSRCARRARR